MSAPETGFTREEVRLALRNPGMPLEALRHATTPVGMHYVLVHFDIPDVDAGGYALTVDGRVARPLALGLDDLRARPAVTHAGDDGVRGLGPGPPDAAPACRRRGTTRRSAAPSGRGRRCAPILEEAGLLDDAVEIVFTGHDRGIDQGVEHDYQRSLTVEEALRDDVLLAYAMNGAPLPAAHGFPLRLIVPGWYGMASVKWLRSITAIAEPFEGVQQTLLYSYRRSADEPGEPVTRKRPRALMAPPGIPEFLSRDPARARPAARPSAGRAWSGFGAIRRVEFSADGGATWTDARLEPAASASTAGRLVVRLGRRARRARALRPRDRRGGQHPAAAPRRRLEHGRLRGQRRPARPGPRRGLEHDPRLGARGDQPEQGDALRLDRRGGPARVGAQRCQSVDGQRRGRVIELRAPVRAEEAVDVQRADPGPGRPRLPGARGRGDPRAVGVREHDVVVLGKEARRRGRVRVGQRAVLDVEQLAARRVAERAQPRPQPREHRAQPGEARPVRTSALVAGPNAAR